VTGFLILICYLIILAWLLIKPIKSVENWEIIFFWIPIILILSIAASLRSIEGDTAEYFSWYSSISLQKISIVRYEPLFSLYFLICKSIGLSFPQTLFLTAIIPLVTICYFAQQFDRRLFRWILFLFIAIFWSRWGLSTIRIGMAAPVAMLAFTPKTSGIKKYSLLTTSFFLHYSAILYLFLAIVSKVKRANLPILIGIVFAGVLIYITKFNMTIIATSLGLLSESQQMAYFDILASKQQISLGIALALFLLFLCRFKMKSMIELMGPELYRVCMASIGMACFIMLAFSQFPIVSYRSSQTFRLFYIILLPYLILSMKTKETKWAMVIFCSGLSTYYFYTRV